MSPLSAMSPVLSGYGLPQLDALTPGATPLPLTPGVTGPSPLQAPGEVTPGQETGDSFASMLGQMVAEVNAKQNVATQAVGALQGGQNVSLHQTVIAMEEANVSFQLMVEVRNKLLESYQEIMRMQL